MNSEVKELTKLHEDLSGKGINRSKEELLATILEFALDKEEELEFFLKKRIRKKF